MGYNIHDLPNSKELPAPAGLHGKVAASDLVQETLLEAGRDFAHFGGHTRHELLGWLRRILLNNLADANRRYLYAEKREAGREVSFHRLQTDSGPPVDFPKNRWPFCKLGSDASNCSRNCGPGILP